MTETRWRPWLILAAAGALLAGLTGLVVHEEHLRRSGREVLLTVEAVDPRDLLSGHYARLDLRETLADGQACPPGARLDTFGGGLPGFGAPPPPQGWISLRRAGNHYVASGMATNRTDALKTGDVVVRGVLRCRGPEPALADLSLPARPAVVSLDIGIDRFHADQKQAEAIEAAVRGPPTTGAEPNGVRPLVIVSVGADGRARLKGLLVAGRRLTLSWF
jgi:uncharacterized membrane-anchored protein